MNIRQIRIMTLKDLKTVEYMQYINLRYDNDLLIDYNITKIAINDNIKRQSDFYKINKVLSLEQRQRNKQLLDLIN